MWVDFFFYQWWHIIFREKESGCTQPVWTRNSWSSPSEDVHNVSYCLLNGGTVPVSLTHSEYYCCQQPQKYTLSWYAQKVLTKEKCSPEPHGKAGPRVSNFLVLLTWKWHSSAHSPWREGTFGALGVWKGCSVADDACLFILYCGKDKMNVWQLVCWRQ